MQYASLKPLNQPDEPTTTLEINEFAPDIFLDIFADDFYKIIKAFASKRATNKNREDQNKFMNFSYHMDSKLSEESKGPKALKLKPKKVFAPKS